MKSEIPQSRPRKIHPLLSRLTPDQKQQLIAIYEQHSTAEAIRLAREKLNIHISAGSFSRLYSSYQIAEDNDTRHDLEAAHHTNIETLTEKQLQLRLLELASRPNMDHTQLRAVCQSFARLQSVKLSERRVQLAESKEARLVQNDQSGQPFSHGEYNEAIDVLFGKHHDEDLDPQISPAPDESHKVGPTVPACTASAGPRPDHEHPNNNRTSSVPHAPKFPTQSSSTLEQHPPTPLT